MALGKLWSVTLDCADAKQLAQFWVAALDGKAPPSWPDGAPPKQFHLDFLDLAGHPFCVTKG